MADTNFMQPWLDLQKKVLDSWQESVAPSTPAEEKKSTNIFMDSMRPFQEAMNQWVNLVTDTTTENLKKMGKDAPFFQETFDKIISATTFQQDLKKFYDDLNATITGKDSDPTKFFSRWSDYYGKLVGNQLLTSLPDQIKNLFGKGMGGFDLSSMTGPDFFKQWLETAQNMNNLLIKSMTGDQSAYADFVKAWQDNFTASFGQAFNLPQFTMNREQMEKQISSVDSMVTFINLLNEYVTTLVKTSRETMSKLVADYQALVVDGKNPQTFKEFYEYWWKMNEGAYHKLFSTDEFSKLMAELIDAGVNYKKKYDELLEQQLAFMPFPSRTDMESVYKTMDSMKREIRALKKEVAMLKEAVKKEG